MSLSNSIAGISSGNQILTILGTICGVLSAAIYSFSEAYVDAAHAPSNNDILEPAIGFEGPDKDVEQVEEDSNV